MPPFIRAGAIIPMGPFIRYSREKSGPLEIRIYPGADGEFTLYEDENDNYDYLKGLYSLIIIHWKEALQRLTISARKGSYPGVRTERTFTIVLVKVNKGVGVDVSTLDRTIAYTGKNAVADFK